jgi:hypothetical protein
MRPITTDLSTMHIYINLCRSIEIGNLHHYGSIRKILSPYYQGSSMKKSILLILLLALAPFLFSDQLLASSGGRTGRTLKTATTGCGGCHGGSATPGVLVSITGPDTVTLNQSTTFTLTITGGPALGSGCDIASKYGALSPVSSSLRLSGGELTQNANTPMTSGSVSYTFNYVYSGAQTIDTLYATGLSTNSNGGTGGDQWNWAPSKRIVVYTPPIPPSAPALLSPANGGTGQSVTLPLIWHTVSGAATYQAQLASDSLFTTIIHEDSALVDTLTTVSSLQQNSSYYWRVSATNLGGTSPWSGVWKFTTIGSSPAIPLLLSPANGATGQPVSLQLVWGAVPTATTYQAQLATDSLFTTIVHEDSTLVDTLAPVSSLQNNTSYYWRVSAKNAAGWGAWSGVSYFTTIVALPAQVNLMTPANNAPVTTDTVMFSWNRTDNHDLEYRLELSSDSTFAVSQTDTTLADTLVVIRNIPDQTYWWRVRARNVAGWGAPGETRRFTLTLTAIGDDQMTPHSFKLDQNYPNPFNPTTTIGYDVPKASFVTLNVFNILGQEVASLVSERKEAGSYEMQFDASNLTSGVYFYQLKAGSFLETRRLLLVR